MVGKGYRHQPNSHICKTKKRGRLNYTYSYYYFHTKCKTRERANEIKSVLRKEHYYVIIEKWSHPHNDTIWFVVYKAKIYYLDKRDKPENHNELIKEIEKKRNR